LVNAPFNLAWGSTVTVYVVAQNNYGVSVNSTIGVSAVILNIPDAPINIVENIVLRSSTSIAITWSNGQSNGGTSIISYQVSYD